MRAISAVQQQEGALAAGLCIADAERSRPGHQRMFAREVEHRVTPVDLDHWDFVDEERRVVIGAEDERVEAGTLDEQPAAALGADLVALGGGFQDQPRRRDVTLYTRGAGRSCPFAVRVVGALEAVARGARSADLHGQRAHHKRQGGARRLHPPRWPG